VAGHVFCVSGEAECFSLMQNYEPFGCDEAAVVFSLTVAQGLPVSYDEEWRQDDDGQEIICGRTTDRQPVFEYIWHGETAGWLVCSYDYRSGRLITTGCDTKLAIDNALMVLYALATAEQQTVLFHAAVVSHGGKGYLFLGASGTGKSTHARLWRKVFGSRVWMVNDDKPMLKVSDDGVTVYGTPWNGKHHLGCNAGAPLKAIIKLSRAPENHIRPLDKTDAFRVVLEHAYGSRDTRGMLKIMELEKRIIDVVDFYQLSCNMEPEAAIVAWEGMNPGAERSSYEDASDE
jgi:hypothetical protein